MLTHPLFYDVFLFKQWRPLTSRLYVENLALGTTCYVVHHVPRRLYQVKCGQPTPTTRMGQHIAHANTPG